MYKINISNLNGEPCSVNKINEDGSIMSIPFDPDNTDAVEFCKWLKDGGIPEAADDGVTPTQDEINAIIAKLS